MNSLALIVSALLVDPGYQEFLAHLEKDPYTAFSKVRQGEDNTAVADNQMKLTNSEGKRMSALMVYLQKKWAGALETNMDSRRSSNRQVVADIIPQSLAKLFSEWQLL